MTAAAPGGAPAPDLLDRWLEHRSLSGTPVVEVAAEPQVAEPQVAAEVVDHAEVGVEVGAAETEVGAAEAGVGAAETERDRNFAGTKRTQTAPVPQPATPPAPQLTAPAPAPAPAPTIPSHTEAGAAVLAALAAPATSMPPAPSGAGPAAAPGTADAVELDASSRGPLWRRRAAARRAPTADQRVRSDEDSAAAEKAAAEKAAAEKAAAEKAAAEKAAGLKATPTVRRDAAAGGEQRGRQRSGTPGQTSYEGDATASTTHDAETGPEDSRPPTTGTPGQTSYEGDATASTTHDAAAGGLGAGAGTELTGSSAAGAAVLAALAGDAGTPTPRTTRRRAPKKAGAKATAAPAAARRAKAPDSVPAVQSGAETTTTATEAGTEAAANAIDRATGGAAGTPPRTAEAPPATTTATTTATTATIATATIATTATTATTASTEAPQQTPGRASRPKTTKTSKSTKPPGTTPAAPEAPVTPRPPILAGAVPAAEVAALVAPAPPRRTPAPDPATAPDPVHEAETAPPPSVVHLHPQRKARQVLGTLLLGALALTALTGFVAYDDPTTASLGIAGACAALTLVLWAVRASTSTATVVLDRGVLDIHAHGSHHRFDLTSHYAVLTLHGQPGQRRWQARFERRGLPAYVVDRSMVDPYEFVAAVRRFRPDL